MIEYKKLDKVMYVKDGGYGVGLVVKIETRKRWFGKSKTWYHILDYLRNLRDYNAIYKISYEDIIEKIDKF